MGSIFVEAALTDKVSVGVNYVPHGMDTETVENVQNFTPATGRDSKSTNTVKVEFVDLTTVYALANLNDNIYAKDGYVEVEAITDENLNKLDEYSFKIALPTGLMPSPIGLLVNKTDLKTIFDGPLYFDAMADLH